MKTGKQKTAFTADVEFRRFPFEIDEWKITQVGLNLHVSELKKGATWFHFFFFPFFVRENEKWLSAIYTDRPLNNFNTAVLLYMLRPC